MDELDDPYTGILSRLGRIPVEAHDPAVELWGGELPPWGPRAGSLPVGGASWEEAQARDACLGEAIERLQAYAVPEDHLVEAAHRDWPLEEPTVEPERWVLFHPVQYAEVGFPFSPLTRDRSCRWVCFREAGSGEPMWIPEDLGFLDRSGSLAPPICPSTSTGLSAGRGGVPVLLRGLQEVIERDGALGAWWGSYPLEEWDSREVIAGLDPEIAPRVLRPHRRYRFYRVRSPYSDHITIVTAEGEDREGYLFAAGSSCRLTRAQSWTKSLLEAIQGLVFVRQLRRERRGLDWADALEDFSHHAAYYSAHPEELLRSALRRAQSPAEPPAGPERLGLLRERLGPGRPILFRIMTPEPIARRFEGWQVLRVVVPGLQPLHGNHRWPHLGGPLWGRPVSEWKTLPPHPLP